MDQPPQYQVVGYTGDGQPVYGDGQPVYGGVSTKTNGLAIATLVLSLVLGFVAIPFGHVAKSQIRRTGEQGSGLATAGLVLGYLSLTVSIALGSSIAYTVHQASAAAARSYSQVNSPPYDSRSGSSSGGTGSGGSVNGGSTPTGQYYGTTTPTTTANTATEATAAAQVAAILSQSGAARSTVVAATQAVGNCTGDPLTEAGRLQTVVSQRQSELQQLSAIPTSALPGGSTLIGYLTTAVQASNQADQDYVAWMQAVATAPCPYPTTSEPHFAAAAGASSQATAAKSSFVALWNPLAARLNLPQYAENQI